MSKQPFHLLILVLILLALPLSAFASEGEAFNPPGAVGALMTLLALVVPALVSVWVRNRGKK